MLNRDRESAITKSGNTIFNSYYHSIKSANLYTTKGKNWIYLKSNVIWLKPSSYPESTINFT